MRNYQIAALLHSSLSGLLRCGLASAVGTFYSLGGGCEDCHQPGGSLLSITQPAESTARRLRSSYRPFRLFFRDLPHAASALSGPSSAVPVTPTSAALDPLIRPLRLPRALCTPPRPPSAHYRVVTGAVSGRVRRIRHGPTHAVPPIPSESEGRQNSWPQRDLATASLPSIALSSCLAARPSMQSAFPGAPCSVGFSEHVWLHPGPITLPLHPHFSDPPGFPSSACPGLQSNLGAPVAPPSHPVAPPPRP